LTQSSSQLLSNKKSAPYTAPAIISPSSVLGPVRKTSDLMGYAPYQYGPQDVYNRLRNRANISKSDGALVVRYFTVIHIFLYTTFTPQFKGKRRYINAIWHCCPMYKNALMRNGGSIYSKEGVYVSCNMGMRALPEMYAQQLEG